MDNKYIKTLEELVELYKKTDPYEWSYDGMHDEIHSTGDYFFAGFEYIENTNNNHDEFGHSYNANIDFICKAHESIESIEEVLKELKRLQDKVKRYEG